MGDRDTLTKNYVKRADRFADIFNYYLFDGKQRIDPAQLREQDTAQIVLPYGKNMTEIPIQRFRDILKQAVLMTDGHCQYVLLGIENQSDVHYAMAVRSYLYDAIEYAAQVQTIAGKHRKQKDVKGAEFLSGFRKEDRLVPVVTLTLYWGRQEWDAPRSLHGMLLETDPQVLQYVNDYRMNLLIPAEITDFEKLHSEMRSVLRVMSLVNKKKEMFQLLENKEYSRMPVDTANLINVMAGLKLDLERWKERSGMEELEMCRAWRELLEDAKADGMQEGRREGKREGLKEGELEVIAQMLRKHKLSLEEIPEFFPKLNEEDIREVERQALAEV